MKRDTFVRTRRCRALRGDHLNLTQYRKKPVQGRAIGDEGVAIARTKPHVLVYNVLIDLFGGNPFTGEPPAEVTDHFDVAPRALLTVPFPQQASGEQIDMNTERPFRQAVQSLRLPDERRGGHVFSFARECREKTSNYAECKYSKLPENKPCVPRFGIVGGSAWTCKLNQIDPQRYLQYVPERIAEHPINRIEELLPWRVAEKLNLANELTRSRAA